MDRHKTIAFPIYIDITSAVSSPARARHNGAGGEPMRGVENAQSDTHRTWRHLAAPGGTWRRAARSAPVGRSAICHLPPAARPVRLDSFTRSSASSLKRAVSNLGCRRPPPGRQSSYQAAAGPAPARPHARLLAVAVCGGGGGGVGRAAEGRKGRSWGQSRPRKWDDTNRLSTVGRGAA